MDDAHKLLNFIDSLDDFTIGIETEPYKHMGAVVVDGILQAAINYINVVKPKVDSVLKNYPDSKTTSAFLLDCDKVGIKKMIKWKGDRKPCYIIKLLNFLKANKLETVDQLRDWLDVEDNIRILVSKKMGIGEVTAEYFRILTGSQSVKIDRHVRKFLNEAGIDKDDKKLKDIVMLAAERKGIKATVLDYSIWNYQRKIKVSKK